MTTEPVVDLLATEWQTIADLGDGLTEARWDLPTDCPGWTVKDNLSHLIGIELALLGEPGDPPVAPPAHVQNDIGAHNEAAVAARRPRSGAAVLAEFRAVTARRLDALHARTAAQWDALGPTPTGENTYRHFMRMRVFDCWVHEQDMRRAVGVRGHLSGPVVDSVLDWHRNAIGFVVGKRAAAPEGAVVAFDLVDAPGAGTVVGVTGGRARVIDGDAPAADTTLQLDVEAYNALLCGRWTADHARSTDRLRIAGDQALGQRVASAMNYLF